MRLASSLSSLALALGALSLAAPAAAYDALAHPCGGQPLTCGKAQLTFEKRDSLPIEWQLDTGWTPPNSPLEVRIQAGIYAHTEVRLTGDLVTSWPKTFTLETPGKPDGGFFEFHYGAAFSAQGKIDIDVAGQHIGWTGDLPYVPQFDFEVQDHETFDPWAFAPGVSLDSTTMPQQIAQISIGDLLGGSIPGIDGGFELDVAMELEATYVTERIALSNADGDDAEGGPITKGQNQSKMKYPGGPHIDVEMQPQGKIHYEGVVHMIPAFYVSILGQDFTIPIVDVPIPFSIADADWIFDPQTVRVPLPDLYLDEQVIDLGEVEVGESATGKFHAWNAGEALLHADLATDDAAFEALVETLDLDPMQTHVGKVSFSPDATGSFEAHLTFASNDPSDPVESIVLRGVGVDHHMPPPDTETTTEVVDQDTGCGCRAAGEGDGGFGGGSWLAGVAAIGWLGRRHARRPRRPLRSRQ